MPGECKVCYDTKILEDTTDAGCTHEPDVCLECLRKVTTCPICRQPLEQFLAARVLAAQTNRVSIRAPLPQQRRTVGPNRDAANSGNRNVHRTTTEQDNLLAQEENLLTQEENLLTQEENLLTQEENLLTQEENLLTQEENLLAHDLLMIQQMEQIQAPARDGRNIHGNTTEDENLLAQEDNLLAHDLLMIQQMEQIQAPERDIRNDALLADDLRRIEYMEHMQDMQQIMEMQHMENIKHYSSF